MIEPEIVERDAWGAKPWRSYTPMAHSVGIVAHHSVTDEDADEAGMMRRIQAEHLANTAEGYVDIGYNFGIGQSGRLYVGRGWAHRNGANGQATVASQMPAPELYVGPDIGNWNTISAVYLGNGPGETEDIPSDAALETFAWLKGEHLRRFAECRVFGHRQIRSTDCPGDALFEWWVVGPAIPPSELQTPRPPKAEDPATELDTEDLMPKLRDLRVGDHDTIQVRMLQSLLRGRGTGVEVDGDFGPSTAAAIETFMRDRDLHNLDGSYDDHSSPYVWESLLTREDG